MQSSHSPFDALSDSLARWLLGFFGAIAAFLLLPKMARLFARRFAARLIAELVAFVTLGLLTEKAVDWLSRPPRRQDLDS